MEAIKKLTRILATLFIVSICGVVYAETPAKYDFDNQLKQVSEITDNNFRDWEMVDDQSFILQNSPSDYYLIVLRSLSEELPVNDSVKISETNSIIKPGYSKVIVSSDGIKDRYVIYKIYKLKDAEQAEEIRAQLIRATK
jgi:hypothetical protein